MASWSFDLLLFDRKESCTPHGNCPWLDTKKSGMCYFFDEFNELMVRAGLALSENEQDDKKRSNHTDKVRQQPNLERILRVSNADRAKVDGEYI